MHLTIDENFTNNVSVDIHHYKDICKTPFDGPILYDIVIRFLFCIVVLDIRFPRKNDILCVFNPISIVRSSYFKNVIWIYLRILMSSTISISDDVRVI